jgi:hypothetical protein
METRILELLAPQGGYALLLALTALWLARVAWPTVVKKHDEAMQRIESGFRGIESKLAALERRETQRIRLEWTKLYQASGHTIEEAELEAGRIMGNGAAQAD